jgi:hypothetical protein
VAPSLGMSPFASPSSGTSTRNLSSTAFDADGVVFTNRYNRALQGVLVAYRSDAARMRDPLKLFLDKRQLTEFPFIAAEPQLECLNIDRNMIPVIQNVSQYGTAAFVCLRRPAVC